MAPLILFVVLDEPAHVTQATYPLVVIIHHRVLSWMLLLQRSLGT